MHFYDISQQRRLGFSFAFGALILSGTYNALAKGLTPYLSPVSLLLISESLTAVFIILTFGLLPLLKELKNMDAKFIRISILLGLLQSVVVPLLWFTGLSKTSATNAVILGNADMVFLMVFSWIILRERIGKMQVAGLLLVLCGIVVVNVTAASVPAGVRIGDGLILLAALFSGIGVVLFKKYLSGVVPELCIVIRNISAVIIVLIAGFFLPHSFIREAAAFPMEKVLLLVAFAFFSRYLHLMFFYGGLNRLPATTFSLIVLGAPLSGLFFAVILLGEHIQTHQLLGGLFIVAGMAMEQLSAQNLRTLRERHFLTRLLSRFHRYREEPIVTLLVAKKV